MESFEAHICCRPLAEALGRGGAAAAEGETFLVFEGAGGALFYKVGHTSGGQFTSACTEPLAFCPFCGRRAAARGAAGRPWFADEPEEVTRWRLGETQEVETVVAALAAARGAAEGVHVTDF